MTEHVIDLNGMSVVIGIPAGRDLHPLVVKSLLATKDMCYSRNIPCHVAMLSGCSVIQWARDEMVALMLETGAKKLFFIDSDIVWESNDFFRILALSQVRGVVCASYPAKKETKTFYIRYDKSKPVCMDEYGLIEICGAGLGFTCINSSIVQELSDSAPKIKDEIQGKPFPAIHKVGVYKGARRGEDMSFFEDIMGLGHRIYLDPSIELGHVGTMVYKGRVLDAMRHLCQADEQ